MSYVSSHSFGSSSPQLRASGAGADRGDGSIGRGLAWALIIGITFWLGVAAMIWTL